MHVDMFQLEMEGENFSSFASQPGGPDIQPDEQENSISLGTKQNKQINKQEKMPNARNNGTIKRQAIIVREWKQSIQTARATKIEMRRKKKEFAHRRNEALNEQCHCSLPLSPRLNLTQ